MARSYKKTPKHGISDCSANHTRRLRRKARRTHNKRVVRALVAFGAVAAITEASEGALFMTRREADDGHWGGSYFGHLDNDWYTEHAPKLLRK